MADAHAHGTGHEKGHPGHGHGDHGHGGHGGDGGHHEEHVHEVSYYVKVYAALIALFLVSVTGPILEIWWLTLLTAFGIAVVKASMVVKYFMHLDVEQRFVHYFLSAALLLMFLFFFAVAPDVMNHRGDNWVNVSAKEEVARGMAAGSGHGEHGGEHGAGEHGDGGHGAGAEGGH